jgi:hypothetical protein
MPVLMRCRSFLASDVDFKVQMSDPDAVVFLDKNRLCQILINGMRYVMITMSFQGVSPLY